MSIMLDYIQQATRTESLRDDIELDLQSDELSGLLESLSHIGAVADKVKKGMFYDGSIDSRLNNVEHKGLMTGCINSYQYPVNQRLLHAGLGMLTEAVEFLDAIHKAAILNQKVDLVNLKEELGDGLWYQAIAMNELGTTFNVEQKRNIAKLMVRYPDKFDQQSATWRDLEAERKVLEQE